jgi:predicted RNase H-like nuclease (RuvC/YqgF family)
MIEIQQTEIAQDGSITVTIGGQPVRMVKESDLGAVKARSATLETQVTNLQAQLATANTTKEELNQTWLREKAAREQAETAVSELPGVKTMLEQVQSELAASKEAGGVLTNKLTENIKATLVSNHKVDATKIASMDLPTLETTLSAYRLQSGNTTPLSNYDGATPPGGTPASVEGKSPLALAQMGYETSNKK